MNPQFKWIPMVTVAHNIVLFQVQFEGLTGPLALRQGQRSEYKLDVYRLQFKRPMRKIETWHPEDLRESSFKTFEPEILIENTTQRVATLIVSTVVNTEAPVTDYVALTSGQECDE
ncbi:uncharacterized protein LOC118478799 [Aplysia californica]|uniref:Uncharacterized protein LOC118478799 n=1 Tax=Aplysia californica TaxID=6500 RepID=A0ABM1W2Q5_APLCA|nr:uncharacterized protein LOC118478799 [Aplysia californica]